MTDRTDTLGRAPIMRHMQPQEDPQPCGDWRGEAKIRTACKPDTAPEITPTPPTPKMHSRERRVLVLEMHEAGKTPQQIANALRRTKEQVMTDLRCIGVYCRSEAQRAANMIAARAPLDRFCEREKIRHEVICTPGFRGGFERRIRGDCLLEIQETTAATVAQIAEIAGVEKVTIGKLLRRARERREKSQ